MVDIDGDAHRWHGWEREKFCIKTPFKSLDDPGIAVSKWSRGNDLEG